MPLGGLAFSFMSTHPSGHQATPDSQSQRECTQEAWSASLSSNSAVHGAGAGVSDSHFHIPAMVQVCLDGGNQLQEMVRGRPHHFLDFKEVGEIWLPYPILISVRWHLSCKLSPPSLLKTDGATSTTWSNTMRLKGLLDLKNQ